MRRGHFFVLIFIAIVIALVGTTFFSPPYAGNPDPIEQPTGNQPEPEPKVLTATLAAVGDIMGHMAQVQQAQTTAADGSTVYDFGPSFDFITPYLMEPDIMVGNLETTLSGSARGYSGFPVFNTPVELAANLRAAGFDLLATANNHSLDMGISGLKTTIDNIHAAGLINFGTYLSPEERDTPLIVDANGIQIAFTAYTKSTNGFPVPRGYEYALKYIENFSDPSPMLEEISALRQAGADVVVVYMHWGFEYSFDPADYQRTLARDLASAGADLILGSHPHVIQPLEWIEVTEGERAGKRSLVAYSLGNFLSNQFHWPPYIPTPAVQYGLLLQIELEKDILSGETVIKDAGYQVTWVHRDWRHRIIPLPELSAEDPAIFNISADQLPELTEGMQWMKDIIETYRFSELK